MTEREEIEISLKALKKEFLKMQQYFSDADFEEFKTYSDITVYIAELQRIMKYHDQYERIDYGTDS